MKQGVCQQCGYELVGLGERGTCPECGRAFDLDTVYRDSNQPEHPLVRYSAAIFWGALALFVLVCGAVLAALVDDPLGAVLLTLLIAGLAGFGSFAYWWSERAEQREREG